MDTTDISPDGFIPRPLKIIVVGAGISGIQFVHDAVTSLNNFSLEVFDKNPCLGGTWYENRYPGCTCDVPSHTYQFSWAPNPSWSSLYPPAAEIRQYLEDVDNRHDLRRFMSFNLECISAQWHEGSAKWKAIVRDIKSREERSIWADVFVYAVGRLNNYKIPEIVGQDRFRGKQVHTANWPSDLKVRNRRIVIIGNGASAVQCTAALQPVAAKLVNVARGPTWIVPHVFSDDGAVQSSYSTKQRQILQSSPSTYYDLRIGLEKKLAAGFAGLWRKTSSQARFTSSSESFMKSKISNKQLLDDLLPEFEAGCRRFTPGSHYLDALQQPNTEYLKDAVSELTEEGLVTTSGKKVFCDIIVYATGFEPYQPRFPVIGRNGHNLSEDWSSEGPCESYMAAMVACYPNFFVFNPPICPVNGSAIPGIERAGNYMMRVITRLQTDRLGSVCVKSQAQAGFNRWVQSRMPHMVWSGPCNSWYKNAKGKVMVPWPGTVLHYYAATEIVRWEDFELEYEDATESFSSFGNGVTSDGFVPNQFPWVYPPTQQGAAPKVRLFAQDRVRGKFKLYRLLSTG